MQTSSLLRSGMVIAAECNQTIKTATKGTVMARVHKFERTITVKKRVKGCIELDLMPDEAAQLVALLHVATMSNSEMPTNARALFVSIRRELLKAGVQCADGGAFQHGRLRVRMV